MLEEGRELQESSRELRECRYPLASEHGGVSFAHAPAMALHAPALALALAAVWMKKTKRSQVFALLVATGFRRQNHSARNPACQCSIDGQLRPQALDLHHYRRRKDSPGLSSSSCALALKAPHIELARWCCWWSRELPILPELLLPQHTSVAALSARLCSSLLVSDRLKCFCAVYAAEGQASPFLIRQ